MDWGGFLLVIRELQEEEKGFGVYIPTEGYRIKRMGVYM